MKLKLITILLLISSYAFAFELEIIAVKQNDSLVKVTGSIFGNDDHIFISKNGEDYTFIITKIIKTEETLQMYCDDVIIGMQFLRECDGNKLFNITIIFEDGTIAFLTRTNN